MMVGVVVFCGDWNLVVWWLSGCFGLVDGL